MGVPSAVFESAGKRSEHYVPGVYSRSNNVSSPSGVSANNFVIMGESVGGKPNTLLTFGSYDEAKDVLGSGPLLKAIGFAFNTSGEFAPSRIKAMRVGTATQATGTIAPLTIKSKAYGVCANQVQVNIAAGSDSNSKKVTVKYQDNEITKDNVIRESLKITATTSTAVVVAKDKITVGSNEYKFSTYTTLISLAGAISSVSGISADVLSGDNDLSEELDIKASQNATSTGLTLYSNTQAVKETLEGIDYIGEVTIASTGRAEITPKSLYLSGATGSDSVSTTDWTTALTALSLEDVQIIATPSYDQAVHNLINAHCKQMSNVVNRKERTCILGANIGTDNATAKAAAKTLNSSLASYVIDSGKAADPDTGEIVEIPGATIACILGAMESAMAINNPLTFKELNVIEVGKKRTISEMEDLIQAGVITVQPNPTNVSQIVCIRAVTTSKKDDLISCERSMIRESLYMDRDLRSRFDGAIGGAANVSTGEIIQTLNDAAKDWYGQGLIIPNDSNKNVWGISVRKNGDKIYLSYARYLTAPLNFIFLTASNHVYESTTVL